MKRLLVLVCAVAACGDNNNAATGTDAPPVAKDAAMSDAPPDAPMVNADANPSDEIAMAKMTADGTGLSLTISHAVVTYLKPQIGSTTNDPAGFTIQARMDGPALFVSVDPATTTPVLARGDVVSFTITGLVTVGGQKRASAISSLVRKSQGFDVTTFSQNVTAATDLVTNLENYESELIDITGMINPSFSSSGSGFEKIQLTTTGMAANASFVVRVPTTLRTAIDMVPTCTITLNDTPVGKFFTPTQMETQLAAFTASDITLMGCPAPNVVSAAELSATSVRLTFSRNILPGSVMANGSQFTFDNGLTASAATVSGRTVTLTTSAQAVGTTYTVTVANTVTDLQGSPVGTPNTATFAGFVQPAIVRINEVNANIAGGCDLIELRVISGGSLGGIRVQERTGSASADELHEDLPSVMVAKNDIVVLHLNSMSTTCNPGSSTNETMSIAQNPAATFARNYDTAWDLFLADGGLVATDNVITLFDKSGTISDVVFIDDDTPATQTPNNVAAATETAAATAAAANQWQMVGGGVPTNGFVDDNFRIHAVVDSNAPETANHAGANSQSLRRIDDTDDNDKADWAQGLNTWGLINAGQSPLP